MKRVRIVDTLGLRAPRLVEARSIITLPDGTVVRTTSGERLMLAAWDYRTQGPRFIISEADGDDAKQAPKQPEQHNDRPAASLDARINSYIDDLLTGDFDATRFAEQLQALAKRAGNVLALERTVLQMGMQRLPSEQRDPVKRALGERFGVSPDESKYDAEAEVQAPRAGRAGPSS